MATLTELAARLESALTDLLEPDSEILRRFTREIETIELGNDNLLRSLMKFQSDNEETFNNMINSQQSDFDEFLQGLKNSEDELYNWLLEMRDLRDETGVNADRAETAAAAAEGAANYEGLFAPGITLAQKGRSYSYNGSIWLCLADTATSPTIVSDDWHKVINIDDVGFAEERTLGVGTSLYKGTGVSAQGNYVQNGDVIPVGTTHLIVLINGKPEEVEISPIASGVVSSLGEKTAIIGTEPVLLINNTNSNILKMSRNLFKPLRYTTDQIRSMLGSEKDAIVEINSGASLGFVELIVPSSNLTQADVIFDFESISGVLSTDYTFNVVLMDDLDRTNTTTVSSLTITRDRNKYTVSIASTPTHQAYIAWSVRAVSSQAAALRVKSVTAFESDEMVGITDFNLLDKRSNWGSSLSEITDGVTKQRVTIPTGQGTVHNVGNVSISTDGSSKLGFPPYDFEFYLDSLYGGGALSTLGIMAGDYAPYRRQYFINVSKALNIIAVGGKVNIMCGRELPTSTWTVNQTAPDVEVRSAPYDPDNHWDSTVRDNSSQPYLCALVPPTKTKSVLYFAFTRVSSIAEVQAAPNRSYFDGTDFYFSFPTTASGFADTCYVYVAESDAGIRYPAPSTPHDVNAFNVHIYGARRWNWRLRPSALGVTYVSLHSCGAYASSTDQGFSINYINGELVDCIGDSNFGDDFNFHDAGHTNLIRPQSYHSGDDGISHHESCTGYVKDAYVCYPAAAYSVPAYGASVMHVGGIGVPATDGLSGKSYQNTWAVLAGSGSSAYANYNGAISYGGLDFSCVSQEAGQEAILEVFKPSSMSGVLNVYASGDEDDISLFIKK